MVDAVSREIMYDTLGEHPVLDLGGASIVQWRHVFVVQ